ncbi:Hypothetical_protein [Hexamita inflata]|uniref:Hypothetical_protein n=1 Tax=Hexamita inflata TaxID=28002 RepID=A0AA86QWW4_9EUKA|nr:Hypothetical protein HINF_LOCUS53308 [Hexamita inflata]
MNLHQFENALQTAKHLQNLSFSLQKHFKSPQLTQLMNQNEQNINYLKQIQQYICERALHDGIVVKAKELLMLFQTAKIEEKTKIEEEFMDIVVSSNALQLLKSQMKCLVRAALRENTEFAHKLIQLHNELQKANIVEHNALKEKAISEIIQAKKQMLDTAVELKQYAVELSLKTQKMLINYGEELFKHIYKDEVEQYIG